MAPPQNVSHLTFKFWKVCPVPSLGFLFCTYGCCFAHVFLDWSANTVLEVAVGDGIDGDHLAASEASRAFQNLAPRKVSISRKSPRIGVLNCDGRGAKQSQGQQPLALRMYQQIFREDTSAVIV